MRKSAEASLCVSWPRVTLMRGRGGTKRSWRGRQSSSSVHQRLWIQQKLGGETRSVCRSRDISQRPKSSLRGEGVTELFSWTREEKVNQEEQKSFSQRGRGRCEGAGRTRAQQQSPHCA